MAIEIKPVSELKRAAALLERLRETRAPIIITQNGQAAAVLQDVDSYEQQQRAFALLKLCIDGERSIEQGKRKTLTEFKKSRAKRLKEIKRNSK